MSNRWSETMGVVLVMLFFFTGCEQGYVNDEGDTTSELDPDRVSVSSDFAAEAFEASGGLDTWTEAKKLGCECVVTFYEPDGSFYLTEQHYDVYPWSNVVKISGREPEGEYAWWFSNGQCDVLLSPGQDMKLPTDLDCPCLAQAILAITTTPVRFLDPLTQFDRQETAVKIQGKWYHPIHQTETGDGSGGTIFYQDRDSLLVDMVRITCSSPDRTLAIRGYDYRKIEKEGPLGPARIEIFSTGAGGVIQKRLAKIDCRTTRQAK
jgi:hypothetical protein